jgi:hypothetical protein
MGEEIIINAKTTIIFITINISIFLYVVHITLLDLMFHQYSKYNNNFLNKNNLYLLILYH